MSVYYDRKTGQMKEEAIYEFRKLNYLYTKPLGSLLRDHLITKKAFSKRYGIRMRKPASTSLIADFIATNQIQIEDFILKDWANFTDFFIREPKAGARPWPNDPNLLAAAADARLTTTEISPEGLLPIKGFTYTLAQLLGDLSEAHSFNRGTALILRLTVADCHRFYYIDDCTIEKKAVKIPGRLHTVGPVSDGKVAVLRENSRVVTFLECKHFGRVAMIEVGALTIGTIVNHNRTAACRGDEKGWFEPGASTIVLLFEQDRLEIDPDITSANQAGIEVKVLIGERIGRIPMHLDDRGDHHL